MESMNILSLIILILELGAVVSIIKFIIKEKDAKRATYAAIFLEMIDSLKYEKEVLDNDYPDYPGELEEKDTNEFIEYLASGVIQIIGNKEEI